MSNSEFNNQAENQQLKSNDSISRRKFIKGGSLVFASAAAGVALGGCSPFGNSSDNVNVANTSNNAGKTTKSGLNPNDFESQGVSGLGLGLEDVQTGNIPTKLYTISNSQGAELCITNFGARIVSFMVPDKNNSLKSMVLGFKTLREYADYNKTPNNFYGACVGRFANRIAKGKFSINGTEYQCDVNESPNLLHGGKFGWHFQTFKVVEYVENRSIKLNLQSPDGDMGFPGDIDFYVTYTLNDNNTLAIYYEATTSQETVINVSNHAYWDVSGNVNHRIVEDKLFLCSKSFTPTNKTLIPTGEIESIDPGHPFDFFGNDAAYFKKGKKIGTDIDFTVEQMKFGKGYDHNFCILDTNEAASEGVDYDGCFEINTNEDAELNGSARLQAKFSSEESGITMTIVSTEPGIQFYDGYDLDGSLENFDGKKITQYAAIALEPQHYPDWPNHENFPSCYVKPGETFRSKTEYRFICN